MTKKKTWYTIEAEFEDGHEEAVIIEKTQTKAYKQQDKFMTRDGIKSVQVDHHYEDKI